MNSKRTAALLSTAFVSIGQLAEAQTFASNPAATSQGPGQLSVYGVQNNGHLYRKRWHGDHWSTWNKISTVGASSPPIANPSATSYTYNGTRRDMACIVESSPSIACYGASNLGDDVRTSPTMGFSPALTTTPTQEGMRVLLFYIDTMTSKVTFRSFFPSVNSWSSAQSLNTLPPGGFSQIAAASKDGDPWVVQICGRTSLNAMWCTTRNDLNDPNVTWSQVPGQWGITGPSIAFNQIGAWRIGNLVGAGTDNRLYYSSLFFAWSTPEPHGDGLTSSPSVTSWGGDTLHIFARRTDNRYWYTFFDQGAWAAGWTQL